MVSFKKLAVLAASSLPLVKAFWRMECQGRVGYGRLDPIVSPGVPSSHAHTIHGSSGFGLGATYSDLMAGQCTSCRVTQDRSTYWTPGLYFQDATTNEFELVPQVGGMLAYYLLYGENIKAFPPGFQLIAGDTYRRTYTAGDATQPDPAKSFWAELNQTGQDTLAQRALGFNCLNYAQPPEGTLYRHYMPDKAYLDEHCTDGIRLEMMFPSCWNGKDVTSPDHHSHVAYPDLIMGGNCPKGFETQLPSLLYETIWNTYAYKGRNGRFVLANGDTTGFGYHGDFMMGWDQSFLQSAINTCTNPSGMIEDCPLFNVVDEATARACEMTMPTVLSSDNYNGPAPILPGNVQITYTNGQAPAPADPAQPASSVLSYSAGPTPTNSASPGIGDVFKETVATSSAISTTSTTSSAQVSTLAPVAPAPSPSTTAAPKVAAQAQADPSESIYSTQWVTAGDVVSEILWVQETVYVTEYDDVTSTEMAQPTGVYKRHDHAHQAHHRRHVHHHHRH